MGMYLEVLEELKAQMVRHLYFQQLALQAVAVAVLLAMQELEMEQQAVLVVVVARIAQQYKQVEQAFLVKVLRVELTVEQALILLLAAAVVEILR